MGLEWLTVIHLLWTKGVLASLPQVLSAKRHKGLCKVKSTKLAQFHVTDISQPPVGQLPIRYYRATEPPGCTPTKTASLQLQVYTSSGLNVSQAAQSSRVTHRDPSEDIPPHDGLNQTLLKEDSVGCHTQGALPVGDRHVRLDVPNMVRGLWLAFTPALPVGVALSPPPPFNCNRNVRMRQCEKKVGITSVQVSIPLTLE